MRRPRRHVAPAVFRPPFRAACVRPLADVEDAEGENADDDRP
jgi:hypothetical protein